MELIRLSIVYVHLIACCVAVGLVLTSDVAMLRSLFTRQAGRHAPGQLEGLQRTVGIALAVLWITGTVLVTLDSWQQGLHYFDNPKIRVKILIVSLLTLNGALLHGAILPALEKAGSVLKLAFRKAALAAFAGSVSAVSWFYAALLGVGRPLSWKYSLPHLFAAYPVLVFGGTIGMMVVFEAAKFRQLCARLAEPEPRPFHALAFRRARRRTVRPLSVLPGEFNVVRASSHHTR
jgi:hypothetical protein